MLNALGQYSIKHIKTYTVAFAKMRSQFYNNVMYCCVSDFYLLINVTQV